ncbi:Two-component system YycF/YycG regulatory protein YycH [Bacillus sp. THAF10]|uniref:YycH family regulatory protein n=1 Tax=Bacillus sp. THAF10 TaxID=2587848 RepID=UPI0012A9C0F8|nr:two-component system activity regulator YycH [Bacillus sp. THAF10]QFT91176.1 Two-component system YycF/YycG regulatory protein YycH [Bacillus sp. THAF10]
MKYENMKSLILTILVIMSLVLTWNLWTYQPDFDYIDSERVISDVQISETLESGKLIQPTMLLFHYAEEHHGTIDVSRFLEEFKRWNLFDIEYMNINQSRFDEFMHGNRKMEIVFPDDIPMPTLRYLTGFSDNEINVTISRIVVDFDAASAEEPVIYLVNYEEQQVYQAKVQNLVLSELERNFYQTGRTLPVYLSIENREGKYLFYPALSTKDEQKMSSYNYYIDQLNPEDFKNALFDDPSIVTNDQLFDGEVYRDDSRLLRVFSQDLKLQYVNPGNTRMGNNIDFNVIERGIDFVNEHAGWSGPIETYNLDSWSRSPIEHTVTFRMYKGDYPIVNLDPEGVAAITQSWRNNELREYVRPSFEFGLEIIKDTKELPSGNRVIRHLQQANIDISKIEVLRVGYDLKKDPNSNGILVLEPVWIYSDGNSWSKITLSDNDDLEGGR